MSDFLFLLLLYSDLLEAFYRGLGLIQYTVECVFFKLFKDNSMTALLSRLR